MLSNKHSHKIPSIKVFKKVEASITKSSKNIYLVHKKEIRNYSPDC